MALQNAILAALSHDEHSGYDLAKAFDITVASYWTSTPQQLYRELDRMEAAGLVEARVVEQKKRPNKRMFSLTDAGREALRAFTAKAPKPTAIRDELLVQVEATDLGDLPSIRRNVEAKLEASREKLRGYERAREILLDGEPEAAYLVNTERIGTYLTLARGIAFEEENIRWCEFVLTTLNARAVPPPAR